MTSRPHLVPVSPQDVPGRRQRAYKTVKSEVRGLAPWQPEKSTKQLLADIMEVFEEYASERPFGPRTVEYQLLERGYIKTERHKVGAAPSTKSKQHLRKISNDSNRLYRAVITVLGRARRAEGTPYHIPPEWVADDFYIVSKPNEYDDPDHFMDAVREATMKYRRRLLDGQKVYPALWCEARGMVQRVEEIGHEYGVTTWSSGGDDHITPKRKLALEALHRRLGDGSRHGPKTTVLHIGDHDEKGIQIFETFRDDVLQFAADYWSRWAKQKVTRDIAMEVIEFRRLAVTDEQIADPHFRLAGKDQGYDSQGIRVQAEAIPPDIRAQLIRDAIEGLLDMDLLAEQRRRSEEERQRLISRFDADQ